MGLLDTIQPTQRNKMLGLLADAVQGVDKFASKPFGYDNPPVNALMQLLGVRDVGTTLDNMSYGGSLGTGSGMTWKPKDETVNAAMALAPLAQAAKSAVPIAGRLGQNAIRNAANMQEVTQNVVTNFSKSARMNVPKDLPQRPFNADYPNGTAGDGGSRLQFTMDGQPVQDGAFIAGRSSVGGMDQKLSPSQQRGIADALGINSKTVEGRFLGQDSGRYVRSSDADGNSVRKIFLRDTLSPEDAPNVFSHELSHVIDDLTFAVVGKGGSKIPTTGLAKDLAQNYSEMNTPGYVSKWQKGVTPQTQGYKPDQYDAERMAEAIRVYADNPNYMKTKFPDLAKRIREYVNANPNLNKTVQFNSAGGLGLLGYDQGKQEPTWPPQRP